MITSRDGSHDRRWAKRVTAGLLLAGAAVLAPAKTEFPGDAPGSADHPLLKRFSGSALVGYKAVEWDQAVMPTSTELASDQGNKSLKDKLVVEGKLTRLVYVAPVGKTPLEVYRNHEQALVQAGFKKKFSCEAECAELFFTWSKTVDLRSGMKWSNGGLASTSGGSFNVESALYFDGRMLVGTVPKGGKELVVLLYTSTAANPSTNMAATYLEIVEPKAMQTGQVTVDASAMKGGLQADGKVALYGLYFDTGKAEVKPESKSQLEEMAKLLQAQPALKVYIVGHTDNVGAVEANLTLSQQRAQAVVAALTSQYKVDAKRLQARGVASLAPVATNTSDDGRARNRRVELVVQ